jgi:protein TonB
MKPLRKVALSVALALSVMTQVGAAHAVEPPLLDKLPRYVLQPEPHYPEDLRVKGTQGNVVVGVLVARNGLPMATRVAKSSGYSLFDNEAIRAVRRAEWEPVPEPVWLMVPINFVLH